MREKSLAIQSRRYCDVSVTVKDGLVRGKGSVEEMLNKNFASVTSDVEEEEVRYRDAPATENQRKNVRRNAITK